MTNRVKQTARKSTMAQARVSTSQISQTSQSNLNSSHTSKRNERILQTKRKSRTPEKFDRPSSYSSSGSPQLARKSISVSQTVKVKPRAAPGERALREIKRLQKSTDLQIPRAAFHRLVREITVDVGKEQSFKYQGAALVALQEASESFLVQMFEDAYMCTTHAKRVTLFTSDIQLWRRLLRF